MKYLIVIYIFISGGLFAQGDDTFLSDFLLEDELNYVNQHPKYQTADFSELWVHTENHRVLGMVGSNHQRIRIAFTSIEQNPENLWEYEVIGKSKVKTNVCDFAGTIRIDSVLEVKTLHYGVDDSYKDSSIVNQGVVFASYQFDELRDQIHSGSFSGRLMTKWYTNSDGKLKYDNIRWIADGYMNNAFVGTWRQYGAEELKVCNWADYRIPYSTSDFDIGASEFSPSGKYSEFGWGQYQKAWLYGDKKARQNELSEWWK